MNAITEFFKMLFSNEMFIVFCIATIGYLVGGIKVKGLALGSAGVLLVALIFGHLGFLAPAFINNLGIACFITAVGFIAGPKFFRNFKKNAKSYITLGFIVIISGGLICSLIIIITGIPSSLAIGILTGALTSTPGLAAATEAVAGAAQQDVAVGYGVAYPFGIVGVVLFVQLLPRLLKINIEEERKRFEAASSVEIKLHKGKLISFDPMGMFAFCLAIVAGVLIGQISIPLPGGSNFSLGISGGPLVSGLIFGHFGHIGKVSISVKKNVLETFREFGLMLFLIGAGTKGGQGFVEIISEYGVMLFVYGAIMTLVPMVIGYIFAEKVLKLGLFNNMGSICGGMTSTPALGTLISVAGTDDVATAYAATYPIALVAVVMVSQLIPMLF